MISAVMPTYARADVAFEKGEGPWLHSTDGRRFLDFGAGVAVTALGHCHPHLVQALSEQAGKLWHCSNLYHIPGQERLAERLAAASFADRVFFCNSGAEAVECGLKIVRRYHDHNGHPERYRVVVCHSAFHGRTLATIAAGGQEKHLAGFDPMVEGFDRAPFGNLNELRAAITAETAAILVEPVQGEGGIRPGDVEFLKGLRAAADEFGLLLFFDEVQTGIGRTGKLFAHEWSGVTPDVMSVAKGLGGGFPVGACLAVEKAASVMTAGSHGSTFGGNPLAMAAGNAVMDVVLAPGFLEGVNRVGAVLKAGLEKLVGDHPTVFEEARGLGLMLGIKCREGVESAKLVGVLLADGLLTVPAGDNVVRLLPPLIIDEGHVKEALTIIDRQAAILAAALKEKAA